MKGQSMTREDYLNFLKRAAEAKYGLIVRVCVEPGVATLFRMEAACKIRRKLYYARDHARQEGNHSFDLLSMIVDYPGEVRIVRRDKLPPVQYEYGDDDIQAETQPLGPDQLPDRLFARGPSPRRPFPYPLP